MVCAARTKFRSQSVCSAEVLINAVTGDVKLAPIPLSGKATYQDLARHSCSHDRVDNDFRRNSSQDKMWQLKKHGNPTMCALRQGN
jgi:hypothetical protein